MKNTLVILTISKLPLLWRELGRGFLILFIFLLGEGWGEVNAQNRSIDSLKQVVATAKQDTNKVRTLNKLAVKYKRINLDTSLIYAKQAEVLSKKYLIKMG